MPDQIDEYLGLLWQASEQAGFLSECTFVKAGGGVRKTVLVRWREPDVSDMLGGAQSKQYEIEYRHGDMPTLAEGDLLSVVEPIGCKSDFYVRSAPRVESTYGTDGRVRCALLTRVTGRS